MQGAIQRSHRKKGQPPPWHDDDDTVSPSQLQGQFSVDRREGESAVTIVGLPLRRSRWEPKARLAV